MGNDKYILRFQNVIVIVLIYTQTTVVISLVFVIKNFPVIVTVNT